MSFSPLGVLAFYALVFATAAVHFAFVVYVAAGGFAAWRWPRTIYTHIVAFAWGFGTIVIGVDCPLTHLENWARRGAGVAELPPTGFIAHYITGVLYPTDALGTVRFAVAVAVVASWMGYGVLRSRAHHDAGIRSHPAL